MSRWRRCWQYGKAASLLFGWWLSTPFDLCAQESAALRPLAALVDAARAPLEKLDLDRDGRASLAELFVATQSSVSKRFEDDQRIATEHAQLDDDGNGQGSEADAIERWLQAAASTAAPTNEPASAPAPDGAGAAKIFLPLAPEKPSPPATPPENAPPAAASPESTP